MLSPRSLERLATCHPDLQAVVLAVAETHHLTVICGHRGEAEQMAAFLAGTSKLKFPHSRHNSFPAEAVDIAPLVEDDEGHWTIKWNDWHAWQKFADAVKAVAEAIGVKLEWGGEWPTLRDCPHWQITK